MIRSYNCLSVQEYLYNDYKLSPICDENISSIMKWRNEQMNILRQNELLTKEKQIAYYEKSIWPTMLQNRPNQILFGLYYKNEFVGYGGLVHISWMDNRAEVSFLVNTERLKDNTIYESDMTNYLSLIKKVAFGNLKFNRLFTETYDIRPLHISILEKSGFVLEGRMKEHTFIDNKYIDSLIHGCLNTVK